MVKMLMIVLLLHGVCVLLLSVPTVSAVSLSVSPNLQQVFRGSSSVDLSCVDDGQPADGWTVKRTRGGFTEDCGAAAGFGRLLVSYCVVDLSAPSETFWCEDSSGQQSDRVSFSVQSDTTDKGVILEIPALPVRTGSDVILRCRQRNGATVAAYFFIKGISVGPKPEHIITNIMQADEGLYCSTDEGGKSPQSSLRVRDSPTIIHPPPPPSSSTNFDPPLLLDKKVSLSVSPNLQQFFRGSSSVYLSCVDDGQTADGWTVKRTRGNLTEDCGAAASEFSRINSSFCALGLSTGGNFLCVNSSGQQSDEVSISVSGKGVILEIPALPVMAGSDVTLYCTPKEGERRKSSFFRDNVTLGSGPEGKWNLSKVNRSDEGLYSCHTDIHPRSPQSRLRVRGQDTNITSCL
uniref:Ig-like domain-containing protein n=1 Tax=Oreochromis niloticus TaxID=8128 RepID=A0A669DV19_ORENI